MLNCLSYHEIQILTLFSEKLEHVSIFDSCITPRSMAAIIEMPQYVAYLNNIAFGFIELSAKSHSINILCFGALIYRVVQ